MRRELSERADACRLAAVVVELLQISRDPGVPAPPYRCLGDLTRIASVRDTTLALRRTTARAPHLKHRGGAHPHGTAQRDPIGLSSEPLPPSRLRVTLTLPPRRNRGATQGIVQRPVRSPRDIPAGRRSGLPDLGCRPISDGRNVPRGELGASGPHERLRWLSSRCARVLSVRFPRPLCRLLRSPAQRRCRRRHTGGVDAIAVQRLRRG